MAVAQKGAAEDLRKEALRDMVKMPGQRYQVLRHRRLEAARKAGAPWAVAPALPAVTERA